MKNIDIELQSLAIAFGSPLPASDTTEQSQRSEEAPGYTMAQYLTDQLFVNSTLRHGLFQTPQEFRKICREILEKALEGQ